MPKIELRRGFAALLPLLGAALIAGCGGGKSEQDVKALLDRAFKQPVKSADVKIDAELKVDGLAGFDKPVRLQAQGPYVGNRGKLPLADIDLKIGASGAGQTVQSGFLSTGDRAFVKFGGQFYEQPKAYVARANRELAKSSGKNRGSLSDLGLNPRKWVVDAKAQGEADVAGVTTQHVSGKLDVRRMFADLNKLVERSAGAVGGANASTPQPLTPAGLDQLAKVVEDPTFDIYVGKDDNTIRRVSGSLAIKVPPNERARVNGITGGTLRFSVELAKVNGGQRVEAPAKARPISDLTAQLQGASALGALGGGGAGDATPPTTSPQGLSPTPQQGGTDSFKRYSDCLDKARPGDTAALSRCTKLLR